LGAEGGSLCGLRKQISGYHRILDFRRAWKAPLMVGSPGFIAGVCSILDDPEQQENMLQ
jgi:hypothetical protein